MADPEKKPWFGPHRLGWGYGPVAWQGWAVTLAATIAIVLAIRVFGHL